MKASKWLCLAICVLTYICAGPTTLSAAPPEPSHGSAVVDGNTTEWDLVNDFFGYMYRAGNPAKPIESSVHLRYDCSTNTVYVLVLTNGVPGIGGPTYAPAAWAAINKVSNKVYTGNTVNDDIQPEFAWVGVKYDGVPDHVQGYEASFHLDPGSYQITVHIEVYDSGAPQTSATEGFPGVGLPLLLDCTRVSQPDIHVNKLISFDKKETWLDAETPPIPTIWEGSEIWYKLIVNNTGNEPLSGISLTDSMYDTNHCTIIDPLPVGGEFECELGPFEAGLGLIENIAKVSGDYGGTPYTNMHYAYYTGERKPDVSLSIIKLTNGNEANLRPGPQIFVDELVTWKYIVTNTGTVDLSNVTVTDDREGLITECYDAAGVPLTEPIALPVRATMLCIKTGTATYGQYDNTAVASGYYGSKEYTARTVSHYYGEIPKPEIRVVKLTQGYDWSHTPPGPYVRVGDPVKWEYIITNIGNVPLTDVEVTDNMLFEPITECYDSELDSLLTPPFDLEIRQSAVCVAAGTADRGQYSNTATATGLYKGAPYYATDISHYFGAEPSIAIEKFTNGETAPYILAGAPVTWAYQVTNTGNVELSNVTVTDDKLGPAPVCVIPSLPAAEITTCTATGKAMNSGTSPDYINTATVIGTAPAELGDVTATASSQYEIAEPGIDVMKYASVDGGRTWLDAKVYPWPQILVPGQVSYKYVVSNTGNVPLYNVAGVDPAGGCTIPSTLGPQQSFQCVYGPLASSYGLNTNSIAVEGSYTDSGGSTVEVDDTDYSSYFGTLCSYTQGGYAGGGKPGLLFKNNFLTVFPQGLQVGTYLTGNGSNAPNGYKWEANATGLKNLQAYLAGGGTSGAITADQLNPVKDVTSKAAPVSGGTLARQTATVTLNAKFSDNALSMPHGYRELLYCNPGDPLDGKSVSQILTAANDALANGLGSLPAGYSYASLNNLLNNFNRAFDNCVATDWAQTYLKTSCQ